jgi:hypothetical protein
MLDAGLATIAAPIIIDCEISNDIGDFPIDCHNRCTSSMESAAPLRHLVMARARTSHRLVLDSPLLSAAGGWIVKENRPSASSVVQAWI